MKFGRVALLSILIFSLHYLSAQDFSNESHKVNIGIPDVALIAVRSGSLHGQFFRPNGPESSGDALQSTVTQSDFWVNYSSVAGNQSRAVMVALEEGTLPEGLDLYIAAQASITGQGQIGTPVGKVKLSTAPNVLIQNIGTGYTESGVRKGHQLNYELKINQDQFSELNYDDLNELVIAYTITDR